MPAISRCCLRVKGWLMAEFGADKKQDALDLAKQVMESFKRTSARAGDEAFF